MGSGGTAAGSGATPAGTVACTCGPQFVEGKPAGAQGRPRTEHRKRRASTAVQHQEIVTESNKPSRGTAPAVSREAVSERMGSLVCVVAAETCLRRRNACLPGIICRRLQITAVRGLHLSGADERRPRDAVVVAVGRAKILWLLRLSRGRAASSTVVGKTQPQVARSLDTKEYPGATITLARPSR